MKTTQYLKLKEEIIKRGYQDEIEWSEGIKKCTKPFDFWCEYSWVVINSGMKNQVARIIWDKVYDAIMKGHNANDVFGHKGKSSAITQIWKQRNATFEKYQEAVDKLAYLRTLPWIGKITQYHLAKNLGHQCIKPDRHLVRIAKKYNTKPHDLCKKIAEETGDKLSTVDTVLWRAANLGLI